MTTSISIDALTRNVVAILDELEGGLLGALGGSSPTVGAILSWLERESLTPTEMMDLLQRLRAHGRLGQFLNLVSHRDMRRFLREREVPWQFILQNWEPDADDSGVFFGGFIVGAGENVYDAVRFVAVIVGSPFSEELARERDQFWEAIKLFLSSPLLLIEQGIEQLLKAVEERLWNLEFFEAGRILGNVTVVLLTLPSALRKLPDLARKVTAIVAKLARLTLREIQALGVSVEKLLDFALNPRPLLNTTNGFILMEAGEDIVLVDRASRPVGRISKGAVIQEASGRTPAAALSGLARLNPRAKDWLVRIKLWDRARKSLPHVGDDIIDAINTFFEVDGFGQVLASYLSGSDNLQQGMRFVLRYARAKFADKVGKVAMRFELPTMGGRRVMDIFVEGVRYELKSVREVSSALVAGDGQTLGQLARDLVNLLDYRIVGGKRVPDLTRLKSLRWVFDSQRTRLTRADVVKRLQDLVAERKLFAGYAHLDELLKVIDEVVEFWPPGR